MGVKGTNMTLKFYQSDRFRDYGCCYPLCVIFRWLIVFLVCSAPIPAQQITAAARQQDFDYITVQLPKLHPNFFFQLDPAVFQQAANDLKSRITTATDAEFYVGLSQLVALAGDAHTNLYLVGAPAIGFQTIPVTFHWLDDGVFVTGASAPYSRALGAQLVAVGSTPIADVMTKLSTVIPHANDQWVRYTSQQYLACPGALQGLHILATGAPWPYTFRALTGEQFTLQLSLGSGAQATVPDQGNGFLPAYLRNADKNYWYSYSAANRLLYFKYNKCEADPALPFANFASSVLQTMDTNPVDSLVFDMRGNTGGDDSLWDPLVFGLQDRLPAELANLAFRTYVIIDKGTFSSGMDDSMALKQPMPPDFTSAFPNYDFTKLVQLVGEPTGGKPAEYGNITNFTLPGSKLGGQYSTKYFPILPYVPDLPSLMPDIPIAIRSTDYFARHDPVMAAIVARSNGAPAAPSGTAFTVNGASFRTDQGVAAGSFAAAFGNFGSTPDQVVVGGAQAKVVSAAASQVNFQVPTSLAAGRTSISVRAGGSELGNGQFTVSATGPGIFILNATDGAQPGAVENQDYTVNAAANPAKPGSVVQIFATGYGKLDGSGNTPAQVYLNGEPVQVVYSGSIAPGLWQINAVLPADFRGQATLFVVAGALASNAVTIAVQ
jgi:uncharacterized protein (TIGR03437 family)